MLELKIPMTGSNFKSLDTPLSASSATETERARHLPDRLAEKAIASNGSPVPAGSVGLADSNHSRDSSANLPNGSTTQQNSTVLEKSMGPAPMESKFDQLPKWKLWFKLATSRPVVKRALFYALVVGLVLNLINQGPSFWYGTVNEQCYCQMFLTACVPYVVSTLSSVQAMMQKCSGSHPIS